MIDHVTLYVSDAAAARSFYAAALAPLDYAPLMDFGTAIGFGVAPKPDLWVTYGAFVLDADGNNIEAVCHGPA